MTSTTRIAPSRTQLNGDLNVNAGQLGIFTVISGATTSLNMLAPSGGITRYFSSYEIEFSTLATAYLLTLPPINSANIAFGWKSRLLVRVPIFAAGFGSSQTLNILSSTSVNLYVFNCITNGGASSTTSTAFTFTITAIGPGTGDWLIETEEPYLSEPTSTIIYNPNSNNSLQMRQYPSISKLYFVSAATTNVNVLFAVAVPIVFTSVVVPRNSYDLQYYTFISTNSVVTFNAAGTYYIEFNVALTAAGGATTTNCQFQIRVNGTTNVPMFSVGQTAFSSYRYIVRAFVTVAAGNFIQIFGGRTVISLGTLTVGATSVLNINCCGV